MSTRETSRPVILVREGLFQRDLDRLDIEIVVVDVELVQVGLRATEAGAAATELLGVAHVDVTAERNAFLGRLNVIDALRFDDLLEVLLILGVIRGIGGDFVSDDRNGQYTGQAIALSVLSVFFILFLCFLPDI